VSTRREGYYVLYSLDGDVLLRLPDELQSFLES
jgi:hypothetical protein